MNGPTWNSWSEFSNLTQTSKTQVRVLCPFLREPHIVNTPGKDVFFTKGPAESGMIGWPSTEFSSTQVHI